MSEHQRRLQELAPRSAGRWRRLRGVALGALILLSGGALFAEAGGVRDVTAPSGPSLVARIETGVDWGSWGRAGASGDDTEVDTQTGGEWLLRGFDLDGNDLYRLNCRACHGPEAKGSKSGIPSLHGALIPRQTGGQAQAPELEVRHRLLAGGRIMPAFGHLEADEVAVLIGYLQALRNGKPTPAATVHQPAARVGEHVVKAICQICHDSLPGVERQPLDRQLVALAEIPDRYSIREFVRKARAGSPTVGDPKGRMPRVDYLSDAELEAAYVYLAAYPPRTK